MKSASTHPPRSAIPGSNARAATCEVELEPASNTTVVSPLATRYAEPSPTANMVTASGGGTSLERKRTEHPIAITTAHQPAARMIRRSARSAANSPPSMTMQAAVPIDPTCIGAPIQTSARSASTVWSHAGTQSAGPIHATSPGASIPTRHFG